MIKAKNSRRQQRDFGMVVATALLVLGAWRWHKYHHVELVWAFAAAIFILAGAIAPSILGPLYRVWMAFSRRLAWVNSRVLLFLLYYLFVTPWGHLQRLVGRDVLQLRIDRSTPTYWQDYDSEQDRESLEHLF